jgi:hypothetical protein
VAATSSADCFDQFLSTAPYAFIDTPAAAWTVVSTSEAPSNVSVGAEKCKDACQARDVCEYWLFKAQQADASSDGCYLKLAPTVPAADTYTSIKLATGDYTVWPVSAAVCSMWI